MLPKLTYLEEGITSIWSSEVLVELMNLINRKYNAFLIDESLVIEAGWCASQIQIKTTLVKDDASIIYPIECVYLVENDACNPEEIASLMLDYIDSYWNEYLSEGRETFVTLDWGKTTFEDKTFYLRGFVRNILLEKAAEEIFAAKGTGYHQIAPITSET